jgi:hypothetical protein
MFGAAVADHFTDAAMSGYPEIILDDNDFKFS